MLVLNRSAYEQQLAVRDAVRDALINDREAAIETLRTNFMEVLYRMSDEQIAERIIQGSSADELKALHESLIGEVFDNEITDEERRRP
jgi:hypothetical protein